MGIAFCVVWLKFFVGQNEDCSPRDSTSDTSEKLLQKGKGGRSIYVIMVRQSSTCLGWNRSPAQAGCMRQVLRPGALGKPRRIRWRGRWEGGSGWGIHVNPWLIHVNVWQNPLQYCKVISLQLIKINEKKITHKKSFFASHKKMLLPRRCFSRYEEMQGLFL